MSNFTKLFLYAFATGMELFNDSQGALRRIDEILKTDEEVLWKNLKDSIEQSKRINILKDAGVDLRADQIGSDMNIPNSDEVLAKLLKSASIDEFELKAAVQKLINKRNK